MPLPGSSGEPLGLKSGTVVLADHDPRWASCFTAHAAELKAALGARVLDVHHVGSTAVPGLCAKPILDVLVSIPDFERGLELAPVLARFGYEHRPGEEIPDRHYFRRRVEGIRTHHLSLAEPSSRHHTITLAFRDALRADPVRARAYAELKRDLARRFPLDRVSYTDGKSAFVAEVLGARGRG